VEPPPGRVVSPAGVGCAGGGFPRGGALSSAILYVAIVAIWAGVLIPRWLRRDSAASERGEENLVSRDAESEEVPAARPRRRDEATPAAHVVPSAPAVPSGPAARPAPRPAVRPGPERAASERAAPERAAPERGAERAEGTQDEEYKKVLTARRRLLGMLLALAIGSGALAYTKMAAWWVIVPPTVMLLGYLVLLREASRADAERREQARGRAAAAAEVAAARRAAPPAAAPPAAAPPAAAPPAPVPDAEVIDISASLTVAGQEFYDQYADAKLRAVGDLAFRLATVAYGAGEAAVMRSAC